MRGKTVALQAVKFAAAVADAVRRPPRGTVILLYHRIGTTGGTQSDLPTVIFDEQMAVAAERCRVIALDTAVDDLADAHEREGPRGAPPLVVTFDDGTADFVDNALPVLVHHRIPATLYVATEFIDTGRHFPNDGAPLSWAGLAEAVSTGLVTIGSHTHRHRLLDRVSAAEAAEELDRSCRLIEDRLGVRADHFAYPKALLAEAPIEAEVRARFRSAAVGGGRANVPGATDVHRLSRAPVQTADGMRWFVRKLHGGMAVEGALREALNRRRYVGATS